MSRWLTGLRGRGVVAAATIALLALAASLAASDFGADGGGREVRSPTALSGLITNSGAVVVGSSGKPLVGRDGKPLQVAGDGRTLLDSRGRVLRDKRGKPLKLSKSGRVPAAAVGGGGKPATAPKKRKKAPKGRRPGPAAPGATPTSREPIVVGVAYNNAPRLDEVFKRYGGNARASNGGIDAKAVVEYINSTGGVGGRKIELRLREYDTTDGRPYDVTFAEVCSSFADGPRPVAVVTIANDDELAPCLASKGIPLINDWLTAGTSVFHSRFPNFFYQPGSLSLDRFGEPYVRGLQEQGFFGGGARVGLLRYANAETNIAMARSLNPALAAAGVKLAVEAVVPYTKSVNDIGGLLTKTTAAILRFRTARVNRVITIDDNTGALLGLFLQASGPQGYRPLVGISSLNSPLFLRSSLPPQMLRGAVGIGWSPLTDVGAQQETDDNATRARCREIFQKAGVTNGTRSGYGEYGAYSRCSNLLLLREALQKHDGATPDALRAALEAIGSSHQSAVAMQSTLNAERHDGATAYRLLRFDDGCSCFTYHGGLRQAG